MKKIFQYIMLAVVTIVMASCTSDIEETTATTGKSNVQLVVGEFPAFGDSQTRAIGTPDAGKTSWAEGDELLLAMTSKTLGTKYAAFTYNGSSWELTSGELSYKIDEVPIFPHVYYAPNYKWEAGTLVLKEGKVAGTDEYIEGKANITPNGEGINVSLPRQHATIPACALLQIKMVLLPLLPSLSLQPTLEAILIIPTLLRLMKKAMCICTVSFLSIRQSL